MPIETSATQLARESAARIVSSRLHILQSRRLILSSVHRLVQRSSGNTAHFERIDQLRRQLEIAQQNYQMTMLNLGSPESNDYWVVAYSRLIASASALASKLRRQAVDLPPTERFAAAGEVATLEKLIQAWTESMRRSMVEAVA